MQALATMHETLSLWQLLIAVEDPQDTRSYTCEQCWAIMEFLADCGAAGMSPVTVKRAAQKLWSRCPACRAEFDKNFAMLEYAPRNLS